MVYGLPWDGEGDGFLVFFLLFFLGGLDVEIGKVEFLVRLGGCARARAAVVWFTCARLVVLRYLMMHFVNLVETAMRRWV